jgi:hypothetical protein
MLIDSSIDGGQKAQKHLNNLDKHLFFIYRLDRKLFLSFKYSLVFRCFVISVVGERQTASLGSGAEDFQVTACF